MESYIEKHNKNPKPFVWTVTAEKIFDKITEAFSYMDLARRTREAECEEERLRGSSGY